MPPNSFPFLLAEAGRPIFAPLEEVRTAALNPLAPFFAGMLFVGLIVAVIYYIRHRRTERRQVRHATWERIRRLCLDRGLEESQTKVFLQQLREIRPTDPLDAVRSAPYFDHRIAPVLRRNAGAPLAERVREVLFEAPVAPPPPEPVLGGTREFSVGERIRVHFEGLEGNYACTIVSVQEAFFIISLPRSIAGREAICAGTPVEGFVHLHDAFYSFHSVIEEVFLGNLPACRVEHTAELIETQRREFTRIHVRRGLSFEHLSTRGLEGGQIDFSRLSETESVNRDGTLRDLSVGGAAIITGPPERFEVGDFVQFDFHILPDEPQFPILAQVVRISPCRFDEDESAGPASGRECCVIHLQFLGLEERSQISLARTVHALQQKNGKTTGTPRPGLSSGKE